MYKYLYTNEEKMFIFNKNDLGQGIKVGKKVY